MNREERLSSKYTKYDRVIFPVLSLGVLLILLFNLELMLTFFHYRFLDDEYSLFFTGFLGALAFYVVVEFFMSFETQHVWLVSNGLLIKGDEGKQIIPFHLIEKVKESRALLFRSSRVIVFIKEEDKLFLPRRVAFLPKFHKERLYIPFARNPITEKLEELIEMHARLGLKNDITFGRDKLIS